MNEIKAKVYYLISTGEVLVITSEMNSTIEPTTKEQDLNLHPQLKDKSLDEIDYVELDYGTSESTFNNVKSFKVNTATKQLDCTYFTQEELDAQVQEKINTQITTDRVRAISEYAYANTNNIAILEDAIIQAELNSLLGGI